MELEMDCLTLRIRLQKLSGYKYHFCTKSMHIFKAGLSSLSDGQTKYKEKVPEVSDSNENIEAAHNSKFMFTERKRFNYQKGPEKLLKDELLAVLKFQILNGRYHFRLWVFASSDEYFHS